MFTLKTMFVEFSLSYKVYFYLSYINNILSDFILLNILNSFSMKLSFLIENVKLKINYL